MKLLFSTPGICQNSLEYSELPASTLRVAPETKEAPGDRRKQTADETCKKK